MTTHTPGTHTAGWDTTRVLFMAVEIMQIADITSLLDPTAPGQAGPPVKRGAPARLGSYTVLGLLCAWFEITTADRPVTFKELVETLWIRYTDEQMTIIGLGGLRDPARQAAMRPNVTPHSSTPPERRAAARVFVAEYARLYAFFSTAFEPMDDTPLSVRAKPTKDQVAAAAKSPELIPKTVLKATILNRIVAASLIWANQVRYPGTTVHDGILRDHLGDIAVDETHLATGLGDIPSHKAPGNQMARIHFHSRQYVAPAAIGLTLAVAVARPDRNTEIPNICLGANLHHPTGGYGPGLLDAIADLETNRVRANNPANRGQYIVVDGGYTERTRLNEKLTQAGYGLVMKYAATRRIHFEIGADKTPDGDRVPGVSLYQGRPMCPGMGHQLLSTRFDPPLNHTGPELARHAEREALLKAGTMRTSGRPKMVNIRPAGRPKPGAAYQQGMQVNLTCPFVTGTANCSLFAPDPSMADKPRIPHPPEHLDPADRPGCCRNPSGEQRVTIPLDAFKTWQEFMPGTWDHEDWYKAARAANENYNNVLKRIQGGGGLQKGALPQLKAAPFAIGVAMALAITNVRTIETWEAGLDRRGRRPPTHIAHHNRRVRKTILDEYNANHRDTA